MRRRRGVRTVLMIVVMVAAADMRSATAAALYVDGANGSDANDGLSWPSAKASVGAALTAAAATPESDIVSVAAGAYRERITMPADVLLEGGYPPGGIGSRDPTLNRSVLLGTGPGPVVAFGPGTDGSVLDGFTVSGGNTTATDEAGGIVMRGTAAMVTGCLVEQNRGCASGGIFIDARGLTVLPRLRETIVRGNTASCDFYGGSGGGAFVWGERDASTADPVISGCLFEGNASLVSSAIVRPRAQIPGGLWVVGAARIEHSWFRKNQGAGVRIAIGMGTGTRTAFVHDCEISDHSGWGLLIGCPGEYVIDNATLARNGAGAIMAVYPGIDTGQDWILDISRTITWGNGTLPLPRGCTPAIRRIDDCLLEGGEPAGTDVIDADPLFVAGPAGDYYLSQAAAGQPLDSPALDAGNLAASGVGLETRTTRTDSVGDAGQVDHGVHYPAFASLTVLRNTAPTALVPIATIVNLPYDDPGVFPDPARPLLFYSVETPMNEIHASKSSATGTVRLSW